jgi:tetraacyldisaccharide 4'-kinase
MMPKPGIIITTEKDAVRMTDLKGLSTKVRENLYYLPIDIKFLQDDGDKFNQLILDYVRKNSRNNILAQATNTVASPNSLPTSNSNNTGNGFGNTGRANRDLFGNPV